MKLKLSNTKQSDSSDFAALVADAVQVVQELRALDTPLAAKLTAQAFLAAALRIAGTTRERLAALQGKINSTDHSAFEVAATLRRMVAAIRSPNWPRPPKDLRRLNFLLTPATLTELTALGSNSFELFALAAKVCADQHPEAFGTCEDSTAYDKRLVALTLRRDELYALIAKAWGPSDIETSAPDSGGRVLQTFTMSRGQVSVHPAEGAGERLVHWLTRDGERV